MESRCEQGRIVLGIHLPRTLVRWLVAEARDSGRTISRELEHRLQVADPPANETGNVGRVEMPPAQ